MDCPAEENLIRIKLEQVQGIRSLRFDLSARTLIILHDTNSHVLTNALDGLHLGTMLLSVQPATEHEPLPGVDAKGTERKLLWMVLSINFFFFVVEVVTGFLYHSLGLVADALDMLADAFVYALALFVIGASLSRKKTVARISGYLQLLLAVFGFAEVIGRFLGYGETPDFRAMIGVSLLALLGNATSLYLLQKSKSREAHLKASIIFTSTDVIFNLGVMFAGALVYLLHSRMPDLVVGTIVFLLVGWGSYRILQLAE